MADKFAERFKAMLPPNIQGLEDADDPKVEAVKAQFTQQMEAMQQGAQQAIDQLQAQLQEAMKAVEDAQKKSLIADIEGKADESQTIIEAYKAETERLKVVRESMTPEQVQAMVYQTIQSLMTTPDISTPEIPQEQPEGPINEAPYEMPYEPIEE